MVDVGTIDMVTQLGFPIACTIALGYGVYKFLKDYMKDTKDREAELINANRKFSEALNEIAKTINESNEINRSLADTNESLADTVETSLKMLNLGVERVIDKIDDVHNKK